MNIIHEPLRYGHVDGHTDVCYSTDGDYFITCGADGDIRIWPVEEGADPNHQCIGEMTLSVRQGNNKIYVSTGANEIQILTYPEGEREGVLARSCDAYNHIAICEKKNIAALAGEGMSVTVLNLDTREVLKVLQDMKGPCLSVAVCPKGEKLAASAGDGKLRIWGVDSFDLLKELDVFPKVNSFVNAKSLARSDFHPETGEILAYPIKHTVKLLNVATWEENTLTCPDITSDVTVLQYSPCGKYLAAATITGDFIIWDADSQKVYQTSRHESSKNICGLYWNPTRNGEIVYTDEEGQLGLMSHCTPLQRIDDEANNDEITENEVDFKDFIDEDDDKEEVGSDLKSKDHAPSVSSRASTPRPRTPSTPLQPPFMPTSTPDHLDPRYLCWNAVGVVRCYGNNAEDDDLTSKSIEVEFHDSTFHNTIMLPNYKDYTMGSIGKGALIVANSKQLMVIPLALTNKDWFIDVEEYEEIVLVAASESIVCWATSNYLIRVGSVYGSQKGIVSIPGPPVSMSAFNNHLMVAYHSGSPREKDQCIQVKLFKFDGLTVESHDLPAALGPETTLSWLGYSDLGTPAMMDSEGMLNMYPPKCNTWIPFFDAVKQRKNPGDSFFVTAINESLEMVVGIRCKGAIYPSFVPRPTATELPLQPPFSNSTTEKTQMEINMFAWSNLNVEDTDRKYKQTALKIFALACRNDLDQRAFEYMELLSNPQITNLALKYSSKLNKRMLADKLIKLATKLQEEAVEVDAPEMPSRVVPVAIMEEPQIKPKVGRLSTLRASQKKRLDENSKPPDEDSNSSISCQDTQMTDDSSIILDTPNQSHLTPANPFQKSKLLKNPNSANALNLLDKYAGVNYEAPAEGGEKRKLSPDEKADKPVGKQRKLSSFMFSK